MQSPPSSAADVLVAFGIPGDLARQMRQMTFRALYRLERRGLLRCPVVGVAIDDWTIEDLRDHARGAIEDRGEPLDGEVFERFAARLSYLRGDFADPETFRRLSAVIRGKRSPMFYLQTPPSLFGRVVDALGKSGSHGRRARGGREAVRPRPGVGACAQRSDARAPG